MKLRTKVLALIVAATSAGYAQAGGCGHHGGISIGFGGGGISVGRVHVPIGRNFPGPQSIPHPQLQAQRYASAPVQYQAMPSNYSQPTTNYQSSMPPQVVYQPSPGMSTSQPMPTSQPTQSSQPMQAMPQGQGTPNGAFVNAGQQSAPAPQSFNAQPNVQQSLAAPHNVAGNVSANGAAGNVNGGDAGLSALRILASFDEGNAATAEMVPTTEAGPAAIATATQLPPNHFGNWVVNLNGNQTIRLALNQDNSFVWQAMKDGKESSFQGQYRLEGERLVLVRSSDLQQMSGSWTGNGPNYTFKLDGAGDSGLAFARGQ